MALENKQILIVSGVQYEMLPQEDGSVTVRERIYGQTILATRNPLQDLAER